MIQWIQLCGIGLFLHVMFMWLAVNVRYYPIRVQNVGLLVLFIAVYMITSKLHKHYVNKDDFELLTFMLVAFAAFMAVGLSGVNHLYNGAVDRFMSLYMDKTILNHGSMIFVGVYGYIFGRIDIVEKYPDE